MNIVILKGNLTKDTVLEGSGDKVYTKNSIAVQRRGKDAGTDFVNIVGFGKTAEFITKYFKKGSAIVVKGRIQTGSYTNKDGVKVYTTDVIVEETDFCERKNGMPGETSEPVDADGFVSVPDGVEDEGLPF